MKKILALTLAVLLLLSLVACGGEKEDPNENGGQTEPEAPKKSASEMIAESLEGKTYHEAVDYDGAEFSILCSTVSSEGGRYFTEFEGSNTEDNLSKAIFKRDNSIATKYDIKYKINRTTNWNTELAQADMAEDLLYHIATPGVSNAVYSISLGYVANLDDFPHLDFSEPWWREYAIEQMSVIGEHLLAIGDLNMLAFDSVGCIFFNKEMAEDYGFTDIYDHVNSGTWTYECMLNYVKNVYKDTSGDGQPGAGDTYGLSGGSYSALCYVYGGNYSFIVKDEDGIPSLRGSMDAEQQFIDFFQKMVKDHSDPELIAYNTGDNNMFAENRLLFAVDMLGTTHVLRDSKVKYGILPLPKWTADQDDYYTFPHQSASTTLLIPKSNTEYEMTSLIVDDLAHMSRETCLEHYIEGNLFLKSLEGDEDSFNAVLNFLEHLNCDIFFSYRAGITEHLRSCLDDKNPNIVSKFTKYKNSIGSQLNGIVAGLLG